MATRLKYEKTIECDNAIQEFMDEYVELPNDNVTFTMKRIEAWKNRSGQVHVSVVLIMSGYDPEEDQDK